MRNLGIRTENIQEKCLKRKGWKGESDIADKALLFSKAKVAGDRIKGPATSGWREWWAGNGVNAPEIYVVTDRMKFHRGRYAYISGAGVQGDAGGGARIMVARTDIHHKPRPCRPHRPAGHT